MTDIKSSSAGVCNFYSAYKTLSSNRCSDNWQFIQLTPQTEKKICYFFVAIPNFFKQNEIIILSPFPHRIHIITNKRGHGCKRTAVSHNCRIVPHQCMCG